MRIANRFLPTALMPTDFLPIAAFDRYAGISVSQQTILPEPVAPAAPARAKSTETTLTPLMQQYSAAKQKHPDALLMFRLGDFYELFFDDAVLASRELQLTLTSRDKDRA